MTALASVEANDVADTRFVRVRGEVDLSNAFAVSEVIGSAVRADASTIVVDLSETTYLDSSGISMLFRLAQRLSYSRQELLLVVPVGSPVRKVLEITNVQQVIPLLERW